MVWGKGPIGAKFMFVGEKPDDEDELMESPFFSREGQLLRKLLNQSDIPLDDCYLTYAIKCRVNTVHTPARMMKFAKVCRHWLDLEIEQLKPKVIVTLGRIPASLLLNLKSKDSMSDVVARDWGVLSRPVMPWYSPNHILQHGKKCDAATIEFLKKVKVVANADMDS